MYFVYSLFNETKLQEEFHFEMFIHIRKELI